MRGPGTDTNTKQSELFCTASTRVIASAVPRHVLTRFEVGPKTRSFNFSSCASACSSALAHARSRPCVRVRLCGCSYVRVFMCAFVQLDMREVFVSVRGFVCVCVCLTMQQQIPEPCFQLHVLRGGGPDGRERPPASLLRQEVHGVRAAGEVSAIPPGQTGPNQRLLPVGAGTDAAARVAKLSRSRKGPAGRTNVPPRARLTGDLPCNIRSKALGLLA